MTGLFASAAYDYPADVRGYTWGLALDFSKHWWSVRAGIFLEPTVANGARLETDILKARGLVVELEARSGSGAVRVLGFLNTADMGSYSQAIAGNSRSGLGITATLAWHCRSIHFAASCVCATTCVAHE